ncbi:cytochrome c oxidase subunit II (plasmid) [Paraburkholderia acidisoli]|uniref:Cytochrome aa3 subunit 2 n=1 Tax=Paraburkholderia acidisoli TaxID=2571748 RepID=A0A7Z2GSC0_9BURK|nr:cytochrome c oxidase subunit II [Paraburkholderia acidisoli]QGZ67051.1 cytochrome c oxidase subunit II [Paraburkholderia acidisoli]
MSLQSTPLAYILHSAGPASRPVLILGWALTALCVGVCVVIAALLLIAVFRRRPSAVQAAAGGEAITGRGGGRAVLIGTLISTALLLAALVYMLWVLASVASPSREPTLTITVTTYDWWWKVDYDANGPQHFTTANEIHIPVGEPVQVNLKSADVIHAFWVPALAGKTQNIPGQINRQWIQADHPGVYRGQCTQYCGAQHAHMAFEVIAESQQDYQMWFDAQARAAAAPTSTDAIRGERVFLDRCAGCHTVRGSDATGVQAPDLTHLLSRRLIAAGALPNSPHNVMDWIAHAQEIKPQALMPDIALSPADGRDLAAYLATLN